MTKKTRRGSFPFTSPPFLLPFLFALPFPSLLQDHFASPPRYLLAYFHSCLCFLLFTLTSYSFKLLSLSLFSLSLPFIAFPLCCLPSFPTLPYFYFTLRHRLPLYFTLYHSHTPSNALRTLRHLRRPTQSRIFYLRLQRLHASGCSHATLDVGLGQNTKAHKHEQILGGEYSGAGNFGSFHTWFRFTLIQQGDEEGSCQSPSNRPSGRPRSPPKGSKTGQDRSRFDIILRSGDACLPSALE